MEMFIKININNLCYKIELNFNCTIIIIFSLTIFKYESTQVHMIYSNDNYSLHTTLNELSIIQIFVTFNFFFLCKL